MRAIVAFSLLIAVSTASAQTPPPSLPPPMYFPLNSHAQGEGEAAGFEVHRLRDYQITVIVPVNADDLRAVLPEGTSSRTTPSSASSSSSRSAPG